MKQLSVVDLSKLKEACNDYMEFIWDDEEYHEDKVDDYEYEIFECAIAALYGPAVWESIRKKLDEHYDKFIRFLTKVGTTCKVRDAETGNWVDAKVIAIEEEGLVFKQTGEGRFKDMKWSENFDNLADKSVYKHWKYH